MGTVFILGLCLYHLSEFNALEHISIHNKTTGETKFSVVWSNFILVEIFQIALIMLLFLGIDLLLYAKTEFWMRGTLSNIKSCGGPTPGLCETGQLILAELILFV